MASKQERAVSGQGTGMVKLVWGGSRGKAPSLFTGPNEASAATDAEPACCGG